jgi:arylsulfatase A-like enzyme
MTNTTKPNIVVLYADDLGFGDIGCYGAARIPTPNLDRLAAEGLLFRNGYATAATCTPSRYSLLTGSYPWRNARAAILAGDAPSIIEAGAPTMPARLRKAGYRTGIVGKWHLGLGDGHLDWNVEIALGPNDLGFDESFIMAATNDRVPCVYIDNRRVANLDPADPIAVTYDDARPFDGLPTGREHPELLALRHSHGHDGSIVNGVGRIGRMRGGAKALWDDESMAETFAAKAVEFVHANHDRPFFLYYAFHQPHVPRLPGPRFKGSTPHGARGDVIAELDWCVGELLDALDAAGVRDNTLVLFSSDNGPVLDDGYEDRAEALRGDHRPAGPLRGGKYSLFDGGSRVPLIVRWPAAVAPGATSGALVCHVDLHASLARLTGQPLDADEAPDSLDVLDAFLGKSARGREDLIVEGMQGALAYRRGNWALIPPHGGPAVNVHTRTDLGNAPECQLYDLAADIGQRRNCAAEHPDLVKDMSVRMQAILRGTGQRLADGG